MKTEKGMKDSASVKRIRQGTMQCIISTYRVNLEKCSYIREMKLFLILLVSFEPSFSCKSFATSGLKLVGKSTHAGQGSFALKTTVSVLT